MATTENVSRVPKKGEVIYDPALEELFASSIGPAKIRGRAVSQITAAEAIGLSRSSEHDLLNDAMSTEELKAELAEVRAKAQERIGDRKRKRKDNDDEIEDRYMRSLALEEAHDERKLVRESEVSRPTHGQVARQALPRDGISPVEDQSSMVITGDEHLQHESIAPSKEDHELERSSRTVFLANVCTSTIKSKAAKKILMDHLASFIPSLPEASLPHAVESLRFRSTAFTDSGIPKKAAFIKKELMETTTKSTNAYAIYTTQTAAREAMKRLNGTMVLDRHLRVDSVAHPAKQDSRRCVFIGNLGFVDDPTAMDETMDEGSNGKPRRRKEPADVEEGLWRHFSKVGTVESVRVVRDKTTRVGKGFAYVQFWDENAVEKALLLNEKRFPPMLPRVLRVTRAKNTLKTKLSHNDGHRPAKKPAVTKDRNKNRATASQELKSLSGKSDKLLGRAAAARIQKRSVERNKPKKTTDSSRKRARNFKNELKQKGS